MRWNLWSSRVRRAINAFLTCAMWFLFPNYCSYKLWKTLTRLFMVVLSILFQISAVWSINVLSNSDLLKAWLNSAFILSCDVKPHFYRVSCLLFASYSLAYCTFFCSYCFTLTHSFCFSFRSITYFNFARTSPSNCYLSQLPSIYYQHLWDTNSLDPNSVPNISNQLYSLLLCFILKWFLMAKAEAFSPSLKL